MWMIIKLLPKFWGFLTKNSMNSVILKVEGVTWDHFGRVMPFSMEQATCALIVCVCVCLILYFLIFEMFL